MGDKILLQSFSDFCMTQNIIGLSWLLDPQRLELFQLNDPVDRLINIEDLVGVEHECVVVTDLLSHESTTCNVAVNILTDLDFKSCEAFFPVDLAQVNHFLVGVAEPAWVREDFRGGEAGLDLSPGAVVYAA